MASRELASRGAEPTVRLCLAALPEISTVRPGTARGIVRLRRNVRHHQQAPLLPRRVERPPAMPGGFAKAFRDFREALQDFPSPRKVACERRDSNPDPVTDRNLNPVKSR